MIFWSTFFNYWVTCLLWIRSIWNSGPLHCCLWKAELSLLLLRLSHAVYIRVFSSFCGQWRLLIFTITRRREIRWVRRKRNTRSRCGEWKPKRTGLSEETFTGRPLCTCRSSVLEAEIMLRPFMCFQSTTGKFCRNVHSVGSLLGEPRKP